MIFFRSKAFAILSLFIFCSCLNQNEWEGQPYLKSFPKEWTTPIQQVSSPILNWIHDFDDPLMQKWLVKVLQRNLNILVAKEQWDQALQQLNIEKSNRWPNFSGQLSTNSSEALQNQHKNKVQQSDISISSQWEIDIWKHLKEQKNISKIQSDISKISYKYAKLSIGIAFAKLWIQAVEANLIFQKNRELFEIQKKVLANQRETYLQGNITLNEFQNSKVQFHQDQKNLYSQNENLQEYLRALNLMLGQYPDANIQISKQFPVISQSIPLGLPSQLLKRRPDIMIAEKELIIRKKKWKIEQQNLFPSFHLTSKVGSSSEQLKNLLDIHQIIWNIGASISQPIFKGGELKAKREITKDKVEESIYLYASKVLEAFQEVEGAISKETLLKRLSSEQKQSLNTREQQLKEKEQKYSNGLIALNTYLLAKKLKIQEEISLLNLNARFLLNRLNLHLYLAGDLN